MNIEQASELLTGTVEKIVYRDEATGYLVFRLGIKSKIVTAQAYAPQLNAGETVSVQGVWTTHPKFGRQFSVSSCTTQRPTSLSAFKKYLSSGLIKGIGPVYAEKLVNRFGTHVLEVIDKEPEKLKTVPGVGEKRIQSIISAWQDQKEISHVMVFLQEKNISPAYAIKIYKKYGSRSVDLVIENPYRLAEDIWGIGFKIADNLAQLIGIDHNSSKRFRAGILHTLTSSVSSGNVYQELEQLKLQTRELLEVEEDTFNSLIKKVLHDLYEDNKIKIVTEASIHYAALASHFYTEQDISYKIKNLQKKKKILYNKKKLKEIIEKEKKEAILNDDQWRGIESCFNNKITIITGGPGTGKTTLIKQLLSLLDRLSISYKLTAPTGKAAKRMAETTGRKAITIHRLLEFNPSKMNFTKNEKDKLDCSFLIIDETSMIDIFIFYAVLKAVPDTAHILLIGDSNQLPSVGPGNVLYDLITSNVIECIQLTHIFRQAANSLIIHNAHCINEGTVPMLHSTDNQRNDFLYIKENDPANVSFLLKNLFLHYLPSQGISSEETKILVPINKGVIGTYTLNHVAQSFLNACDTHESVTYAGYNYKVGDPVMQMKNNYDKVIFNGDTGKIKSIDKLNKIMIVCFSEREIAYEFHELDELSLAYAMSIHKSQGSEYPAIIILMYMNYFTLLQRNVLYTAITRATKQCILIGQPKAIAIAVKNNKGRDRITFLKQLLQDSPDIICR